MMLNVNFLRLSAQPFIVPCYVQTAPKKVIRCFKVAYNRIFGILLNLEHRVSMSHVFVTRRLDPFNVIMR